MTSEERWRVFIKLRRLYFGLVGRFTQIIQMYHTYKAIMAVENSEVEIVSSEHFMHLAMAMSTTDFTQPHMIRIHDARRTKELSDILMIDEVKKQNNPPE